MISIGVITARLLEPEGRGYYALFFSITGMIATFSHLGIAQSNIYELNKRHTPISNLIGNNLNYLCLMCLLIICFLVISFFYLPISFLSNSDNYLWVLIWIAILCMLSEQIFSGLIYGTHLYDFQSKFLAIHSAILLFTCLLLFVTDQSYETAIKLRVLGTFIFFITYSFFGFKRLKVRSISKSNRILVQQIKFGFRSWLQNSLGFINYRGYFLILAIYVRPDLVGIFSVSMLLIEVIRFLPDSISTLILPRLAQKELKSTSAIIAAQSSRIIFFLTVGISIFLLYIADLLVPFIFGKDYIESAYIFKLMVFGGLFGTFYQVFTRFFTSEGMQKYSIYAVSFGMVIGISSAFVLVPSFGIIGAALSFNLGSTICSIIIIFFFKRYTGIGLTQILFIKYADIQFLISLLRSQLKS